MCREFYLPVQQIHVVYPNGRFSNPYYFHVNDMSGALCNKLLLYAGDSAILVADKNTTEAEKGPFV